MPSAQITLKDVRLLFRNFSGARDRFGNEGKRTFCVVLPEDAANDLRAQGVNVRVLKPRDEDDQPEPFVKVNVKFGTRPPKITVISGKHRTILKDEASLGMLDWAVIQRADIQIRVWHNAERGFTTCWLNKAFITVQEDELDAMYAEPPSDEDAPEERRA